MPHNFIAVFILGSSARNWLYAYNSKKAYSRLLHVAKPVLHQRISKPGVGDYQAQSVLYKPTESYLRFVGIAVKTFSKR